MTLCDSTERRNWSDVNGLTRRVWIVREGCWALVVPLHPRRYAALIDRLKDAAVVIERMANGAGRSECSPELDRVIAALNEIEEERIRV